MIILITGFIGSGKTTLANWFEEREGFELVRTDRVVADLYRTNQDLLQEINSEFGFDKAYVDKDDLKKVIVEPLKWDKLEDIVHPFVNARIQEIISKNPERNYVIEVYDSNIISFDYDFEILTFAPEKVLISRVQERDGRSEEEIKAFLQRQDHSKIQNKKIFVINTTEPEIKISKNLDKIKESLNVDKNWKNS